MDKVRISRSRKDFIIVVVVPIITGLGGHNQPLQPLYAAAADGARNNSSEWSAMVGPERGTVHSMCEHDALVWIHSPV